MSEKLKRNGKSFSKWIAAAALTALFIFNVAFSFEFKDGSLVPDVNLTFLTSNNEVYASSGTYYPDKKVDRTKCVIAGTNQVVGYANDCSGEGEGCIDTSCD